MAPCLVDDDKIATRGSFALKENEWVHGAAISTQRSVSGKASSPTAKRLLPPSPIAYLVPGSLTERVSTFREPLLS